MNLFLRGLTIANPVLGFPLVVPCLSLRCVLGLPKLLVMQFVFYWCVHCFRLLPSSQRKEQDANRNSTKQYADRCASLPRITEGPYQRPNLPVEPEPSLSLMLKYFELHLKIYIPTENPQQADLAEEQRPSAEGGREELRSK